jgi:hypothetical protein
MERNSFDAIAEALFKQKQLMDRLEAENRELRRLLADLRQGRGIFVEISGVRFATSDTPVLASPLK